MNSKFEIFESELARIQQDMQLNGINSENEGQLKQLVSDIKFVIAMGPSESIARDRIDPNLADALDFDYFQKITSLNGTSEIFDDESWGKATVALEERDFRGANVPALVVKWDNYYQFFLDKGNNQEATDKKLNAYSSVIATSWALKWQAWIVEIV